MKARLNVPRRRQADWARFRSMAESKHSYLAMIVVGVILVFCACIALRHMNDASSDDDAPVPSALFFFTE